MKDNLKAGGIVGGTLFGLALGFAVLLVPPPSEVRRRATRPPTPEQGASVPVETSGLDDLSLISATPEPPGGPLRLDEVVQQLREIRSRVRLLPPSQDAAAIETLVGDLISEVERRER